MFSTLWYMDTLKGANGMETERLSPLNRIVQFLREYKEQPFITHEREELVEKLLSSEDPRLRDRGVVESEFLKTKKMFFRR
jgi:hypothetical protein